MDFPYFDREVGQLVGKQMAEPGTMVLGRVIYQEFAGSWPRQSAEVEPIAGYMSETPKLVASRSLEAVEWPNSTLRNGNAAAQLAMIKRQPGRTIFVSGSPTLVRSLLSDGLFDELRLLVHPIVFSRGKRLLDGEGQRMPLMSIDSTTISTGVCFLTR